MSFVIATDFNKVIQLPDPALESEILDRVFMSENRPRKMTWRCFRELRYSWRHFEAIRNMIYLPEYRDRLLVADGVLDVLQMFLTAGYRVIVVTTRVGESLELAKEWFLEVGGPDILFVGVGVDVNFVKKSKTAALIKHGVDVFIDNSGGKLLSIHRERAQFPTFPQLLHFVPKGRIESPKDSPCPFAEPLFSWSHLPGVIAALTNMR
jgi:hypothetical protein